MAMFDEVKPTVGYINENKHPRPRVLPPSEVEKSPVISKLKPSEEELKALDMLEFPLPRRLWQSDNDTNRCACCTHRLKARVWGGKHHCRICGKCVCSICSRHILRGYRICKNCKNSREVQDRFPELLPNMAWAQKTEPSQKIAEVKVAWTQKTEPSQNIAGLKDSESEKETSIKIPQLNKEDLRKLGIGGSLHGSPRYKYPKEGGSLYDVQSVTSDFRRSSTIVRPSVNLSQWKTTHCVRWIRSLGLNESEEKTVAAVNELGLCGSDLQEISDSDLQHELKIYSVILRKRILRSLEQLTQEVVDKILEKEEETKVLSKKDISRLVRDVQVLKRGSFQAIDRIDMLNSPENKYKVVWYATSIRPGVHKVTVIDVNNITNSSYWILKYQGRTMERHCLSTNPCGLRWRLHDSKVEICTNNSSDELNTNLVLSLQSVTLPCGSKD